MTPSRSLLPFVMVAILALLVAACGSEGNSGSTDGSRSAGDTGSSTRDSREPEPGSPEANAERGGAVSFALTPAIAQCLEREGFVQEQQPPNGATVAWRHSGGARLVVAVSSEAALTLASELGTATEPASVDGTTVSAGPVATAAAGSRCLDA